MGCEGETIYFARAELAARDVAFPGLHLFTPAAFLSRSSPGRREDAASGAPQEQVVIVMLRPGECECTLEGRVAGLIIQPLADVRRRI